MDAILYWNQVALDAVAQDHTDPGPVEQGGPTKTSRALAIIHLAMYDAFNGVEQKYQSYLPSLITAPSGTSINAAIGEAACVTLLSLYPSQGETFHKFHRDFLAGLMESNAEVERGRVYGREVARLMLENRKDDGSENDLPYAPSQAPGKHRVDPLNPTQGYLGANWGQVRPFAITNFLADSPPALSSAQYETDFNEVKDKGVLVGGTRTPEETTIGLFWAYDGAQKLGTPPRLYNQIVRAIAMQKCNMLKDNARLFALINLAMADAGIQCWYSKYHYEIWRPVLGIREADRQWGPTGRGDGNSQTVVDPYWLPLGAPRTNQPNKYSFTPNFPAYPSGHATFGAASLDMVRLFYGEDEIGFTFVSDELNGKSIDADGSVRTRHERCFERLSDAITENGISRVYLGVHWRFDSDAGIKSGKQIADYIYQNSLRPLF